MQVDEQRNRLDMVLISIATLLLAYITEILLLIAVFWSNQETKKLQKLSRHRMETIGKKLHIHLHIFKKKPNIFFQGFPQLHLALISNLGLIKDFTIDGIKNQHFPKLPKKKGHLLTNNCKGYFYFYML